MYPLLQTKEDKGKRKCVLFLVTGGKWREASSRDGEVEKRAKEAFLPFRHLFWRHSAPVQKNGAGFSPLFIAGLADEIIIIRLRFLPFPRMLNFQLSLALFHEGERASSFHFHNPSRCRLAIERVERKWKNGDKSREAKMYS